MLAWMLYVIMVTLLLSVGAFLAERAARLKRGGTRWIWITAIVASLRCRPSSRRCRSQLPNVVSPPVAQKIVVLRDSHHAGAVAGHVDLGQRRARRAAGATSIRSLTTLWRGASAAMLLALIASGIICSCASAAGTATRSRARRSTSPRMSDPRWSACCARGSSCRSG